MPDSDDLLVIPRQAVLCLARTATLPEDLAPSLVSARDAFFHNLRGISLILAIPHRISHLALAPEARQEMGELVRKSFREATAPGGLVAKIEAKNVALRSVNEKLTNEVIPAFYAKASQRAQAVLANEDVGAAVRELLCQSLVLSWGAFEVLARDVLVDLVNSKPTLTAVLSGSKSTKKLLANFEVSLDDLAVLGFDLSRKMGDLLFRGRSLDRLETIKAVCGALMPRAPELHRLLADPELWRVYQRRHVVVHRRGVIDQDYLDKSGDSLQLGTRLVIGSKEALAALTVVADAGTELLLAANQVAQQP